LKTLHLLRHAKSSNKEGMEDRERPLNRRGREAARTLGDHLSAALGTVDLVLCSSALRTRQTLDLALAELAPRPRIALEDELYLASREKLMRRLRRLDERDANIILIAHNPGLHDLAIALADKHSANYQTLKSSKFPTGACASFRVTGGWSALGLSRYELIGYFTPESLADDGG
jgi:phosphohistidine phosphatase